MLQKEVFTSAKSLVESVKKNKKLPKKVENIDIYSLCYVYGMQLNGLKRNRKVRI